MQARRYWKFTGAYWFTAGLLLFASALGVSHWPVVMMRFLYFPVLGVLITSAMTLIYDSSTFRRLKRPELPAVAFSILGAGVTAAILNPLTYLLLGSDLREQHFQKMSTGMLIFGLFYMLWSFLYFQLDGRPLLGPKPHKNNNFIDRIGVDDRGKVRTVPIADVVCFSASGDYVEIHLADQSFLKKETILNLEAMLDPAQFARVHRSTIVNRARVECITARGSGAYELTLGGGQVVNASRSYRSVVLELQSQV